MTKAVVAQTDSAGDAVVGAARSLGQAGFRVLPLNAGTKIPSNRGWTKDASTDGRDWPPGANVGIATGQGLIVFDVDVKHGKQGLASLDALTREFPELSNCPVVETPSGGLHLYARIPEDEHYANGVDALGEGLDVRADGGQVVAPPSIVGGTAYRWRDGTAPERLSDIPLVSDGLAACLKRRGTQTEVIIPEAVAELIDTDPVIERARRFLRTYPPAIEGMGGDAHTYELCCRLKGMGISASLAPSLLSEGWNDRCQPPWCFDELERIAEHAADYGQDSLGSRMPEMAFAEVSVSSPPEPSGAHCAIDWCAWEGRSISPREWMWDQWLPKSEVTLLSGDGGVGKSLFAQQLATSVATGAPFLGERLPRGRVFAFLAEDSEEELVRRQQSICSAIPVSFTDLDDLVVMGPRPNNDHIMAATDRAGLLTPTRWGREFEARALAHRPDLIIIDNIAEVFGGNEIVRSEVRQFVGMLTSIARKSQAAVLLLGHPSREGMKSGSGYSGSTAWNNSVRSRLYMTRPGTGLDRGTRLTRQKANYAALDEDGVALTYSRGVFVSQRQAIADGVALSDSERMRLVLRAIGKGREEGRHFSTSENQPSHPSRILLRRDVDIRAAGMKRDEVLECLDGAMRDGLLAEGEYTTSNRNKRRGFVLTDAGAAFAGEV